MQIFSDWDVGKMNKDKLIQSLTNIPEKWFTFAFDIDIKSENEIRILMKYNAELVKKLRDGDRWQYEIDSNGFIKFIRDDGFEIIMT